MNSPWKYKGCHHLLKQTQTNTNYPLEIYTSDESDIYIYSSLYLFWTFFMLEIHILLYFYISFFLIFQKFKETRYK